MATKNGTSLKHTTNDTEQASNRNMTSGATGGPKPPPEPDPKIVAAELMESQGRVAIQWQEPETTRWKKLPKQVAANAKAIKATEVYEEGPSSLHDRVKRMYIQKATWEGKNSSNASAHMPSTKELAEFFQKVMDGRTNKFGTSRVAQDAPDRVKIKQLVADLSKTDPTECFKMELHTDNKSMTRNQITLAWAAAVRHMGCQYSDVIMAQEASSDSDDDMDGIQLESILVKRTRQTSLTQHTVKVPPKAKVRIQEPDGAVNETNPKGDASGDDGTWTRVRQSSAQMMATPSRKFNERFDLRLTIPKNSSTPIRDFQSRFELWFDHALTIEPKLVIYPWYKRHKSAGTISEKEPIPTDWDEMKKFVCRAKPTAKQSDVYMQLKLGGSQNLNALTSRRAEMEGGYSTGEYAYVRDLKDAENITDVGFLAYSGNFTNTKQTIGVINRLLQQIQPKLQVGGRIKFLGQVSDETREEHRKNLGTWINTPWVALHLHANTSHARKVSKALGKVFNAKDADRGGLNYRFVPNPGTSTIGADTAAKLRKMTRKHKRYVRQLKRFRLDGDVSLDTPDAQTKSTTLREFLNQHKTPEGNPYFHDVSTTHMADGDEDALSIVAFDDRYDQAKNILNSIAIRCRTEINSSTDDWFDDNILEMSAGYAKDATGQGYEDVEFEGELDYIVDEDMGSVEIEGMDEIEDNSPSGSPVAKKPRLEDESFKTFSSECGKSRASTIFSIQESKDDSAEIKEDELATAMRQAREAQQAEANRKKVEDQRQELIEKDRIIEELRAKHAEEEPGNSKSPGLSTDGGQQTD